MVLFKVPQVGSAGSRYAWFRAYLDWISLDFAGEGILGGGNRRNARQDRRGLAVQVRRGLRRLRVRGFEAEGGLGVQAAHLLLGL